MSNKTQNKMMFSRYSTYNSYRENEIATAGIVTTFIAAALGYTAYAVYCNWPAITASISPAMAFPAYVAITMLSVGTIIGISLLGILIFVAITSYLNKPSKFHHIATSIPESKEKLQKVSNEFVNMVNSLDDNKKNPAATKIKSQGRIYNAKKKLAKLKNDTNEKVICCRG